MKLIYNVFIFFVAALFSVSCSQTIVFEDPTKPDYVTYKDISAAGTANCYIVTADGNYKFKAVKGNSNQSISGVKRADVLWESFGTSVVPDAGDVVSTVLYKDGYVYFSVYKPFESGNALIAVRNSSGAILWSWHIWCSADGVHDEVYANKAGVMMDRNLGATSAMPGNVGTFGLLYQWGRKDPFLGSCSLSTPTIAASTGEWSSVSTPQSVDYATEHPMTFISNNFEWCAGDGANHTNYSKRWKEGEKSIYDPCPVGYRVPDGGLVGLWSKANTTSLWNSSFKGLDWTLSDGTTAWYPAAGYRSHDGGNIFLVGEFGYYWSASPFESIDYYASYLGFYYSGNVTPANVNYRGNAYSVRCAREK